MRPAIPTGSSTRRALVLLTMAAALALGACDCDDNNGTPVTDAGPDGSQSDGGTDGGNDGGNDSGLNGLPLGSPCTADSQCGGFENPRCLPGLYPLSAIPDLASFGMQFPGGYCSTDPGCTADAECDPGNGGQCFRPFANSTAAEWLAAEQSLNLEAGFLSNLLQNYGVCLKSCTDSAECRTPGYACEPPLETVLGLLGTFGVTVTNERTYCVQPGACFGTDCGPGGVCDDDGTGTDTPTCICGPGFELSGTSCICADSKEYNGTTCVHQGCEATRCATNASFRAVGEGLGAARCVCDDGFVGDGTTSCAAVDSSCGGCGAGATCVANSSENGGASCACPANQLMLANGDCAAVGTTRFVDGANAAAVDGTNDCATAATPCLTIQHAVDQASANDVIEVAAGDYPELVTVNKALVLRGANYGVSAGVGAGSRGAETTIIGFRGPLVGAAHPTVDSASSMTVDGFEFRPGTHSDVLGLATFNQVSFYGGPMVRIVNNIFDGLGEGETWDPDCKDATVTVGGRELTCKKLADSALLIQSGRFLVSGNTFTQYRRPVDIGGYGATPANPALPLSGVFSNNSLSKLTIRGVWLLDHFGSGVVVEGNEILGGDNGITGGVAGIIVTSGNNVIRGNEFSGLGSAIFNQVCDGTNVAGAPNAIVANSFTANRSGVQLYAAAATCAVDVGVHGNSFSGSTAYAVRWNGDFTANDPPATIDATKNWFGDAAGPEAIEYVYAAADDTSATRENVTPFVTTTNHYTAPGGCLTLP